MRQQSSRQPRSPSLPAPASQSAARRVRRRPPAGGGAIPAAPALGAEPGKRGSFCSFCPLFGGFLLFFARPAGPNGWGEPGAAAAFATRGPLPHTGTPSPRGDTPFTARHSFFFPCCLNPTAPKVPVSPPPLPFKYTGCSKNAPPNAFQVTEQGVETLL